MAEKFGHLSLPISLFGKPKLFGGGNTSTTTAQNRQNRVAHGGYITKRSSELSRFWKARRKEREQNLLPPIETGIPILLEVDPFSDIDFLRGLGFEIVCELEEGFIIVATDDVDIETLTQKTDEFIRNVSERCNSPAKIYALSEDTDRLKKVVAKELYEKWPTIDDNTEYFIDVSVSCCGDIKLPDAPRKKANETDEKYLLRKQKWEQKFGVAYQKWDDLKMQREESIERFVSAYNGTIVDFVDGTANLVSLPDSFSARLKISGSCLRDLATNFAYIFEVSESEDIHMGTTESSSLGSNLNADILAPPNDSPVVCVLDSGIQEKHKYLEPAIQSQDSVSMLPGEKNVNDEVAGGGHGTRVAGAILYPDAIPISDQYQLPCRIRNVRILDSHNHLPMGIFPPKVLASVIEYFADMHQTPSKIFNHSVGGRQGCEIKHMSTWAAEIDMQTYDRDILVVQAAGNLTREVISAFIKSGHHYPDYLGRELTRICDPSQSLHALSVGSVGIAYYETDDSISLGGEGEVSSFSRSGPGIWDSIKPDVVESGGTHVVNKFGPDPILTTPDEVCPELIRRSPEGPAYSRDQVGTSFAAPKVTRIAAEIEKIFPNSPALLYRGLIAQSARWPQYANNLSEVQCRNLLRRLGYGIPDLERSTRNSEYRITLITPGIQEIGPNEAQVFKIPVPDELNSVGEDYSILIEVTLSYAAKPRRTRRYAKNYLSTWLDWQCSNIGESSDVFMRRVFETGSSISDEGTFQWMIGDAVNRGNIQDYSRQKSTLQKDWCIIKSNHLSDAFCIAVRGHKGWGDLFKAKYSLVVSLEAIDQDIPIYESIRSMVEVEIENEEIEVEM